jgi:DNA-binding transcriptional MerR regulator/uncharacterized protein (DUF433 family)
MVQDDSREIFNGYYDAKRAAALSGVPASTVYHWARTGLIVPSVSKSRVKLWSYADLMALRITYWLRNPKDDGRVRATPMSAVREVLYQLEQEGVAIWTRVVEEDTSPILVDPSGRIHVRTRSGPVRELSGQTVIEETLNPLAPFSADGFSAPDLVRPRPDLRIIPGRVDGQPHLAGTRVSSLALAALDRRGFSLRAIQAMYPTEDPTAVVQAIDLERELTKAA